MTDAELLRAAIDVSGLDSTRGFALRVLDTDDGNVRQILRGEKGLGKGARVICMVVMMHPELTDTIALAVAQLHAELEIVGT